ncbi:Cytochrome c' [compost metagenome]
MLKTSEDLGGMLRGRLAFDGQKFADGAVKLDNLSREPWKHFPQVREEDDTSARTDVWEKQARFQDLARQMEATTAELVAVTRAQPLKAAQLTEPMNKVEAACKACHTEFRNH